MPVKENLKRGASHRNSVTGESVEVILLPTISDNEHMLRSNEYIVRVWIVAVAWRRGEEEEAVGR
jgi:hypothetical protein